MPPQERIHPPELVPDRVDAIEHHEQVDVRLGVRVSARPGAEEQDAAQSVAVELSEVSRHVACDLVRIELPGELGELWIGPLGDRPLGSSLVDEALLEEPPNRTPLDPGVM